MGYRKRGGENEPRGISSEWIHRHLCLAKVSVHASSNSKRPFCPALVCSLSNAVSYRTTRGSIYVFPPRSDRYESLSFSVRSILQTINMCIAMGYLALEFLSLISLLDLYFQVRILLVTKVQVECLKENCSQFFENCGRQLWISIPNVSNDSKRLKRSLACNGQAAFPPSRALPHPLPYSG